MAVVHCPNLLFILAMLILVSLLIAAYQSPVGLLPLQIFACTKVLETVVCIFFFFNFLKI